jgi:hypothetical protein
MTFGQMSHFNQIASSKRYTVKACGGQRSDIPYIPNLLHRKDMFLAVWDVVYIQGYRAIAVMMEVVRTSETSIYFNEI